MSTQPTTPVKVPSAAANYTPATLDPDLRSQVNTLLLKEDLVSKIQESLLHSLHSHPDNWPTAVQSHALSLLRSGEATTFPELLRRVLEDIRQDTAAATASSSSSASAPAKSLNGSTEINGKRTNGDASPPELSQSETSLAVPQAVVEEALRMAKETLGSVVELDGPDGDI